MAAADAAAAAAAACFAAASGVTLESYVPSVPVAALCTVWSTSLAYLIVFLVAPSKYVWPQRMPSSGPHAFARSSLAWCSDAASLTEQEQRLAGQTGGLLAQLFLHHSVDTCEALTHVEGSAPLG